MEKRVKAFTLSIILPCVLHFKEKNRAESKCESNIQRRESFENNRIENRMKSESNKVIEVKVVEGKKSLGGWDYFVSFFGGVGK